jgi:hypothetical protein
VAACWMHSSPISRGIHHHWLSSVAAAIGEALWLDHQHQPYFELQAATHASLFILISDGWRAECCPRGRHSDATAHSCYMPQSTVGAVKWAILL